MAILRIGLTGGIASGKSAVASRFRGLGVPVIDADEISREQVAPGSAGLAQVVARFGARVLSAAGELDRRALRDIVFTDAASRKDLESILHPPIRDAMEARAASVSGPYVVLCIPLLVESGDLRRVDRVLVVDVQRDVQLARVMARDSCSKEQALAIIAAQVPRVDRLRPADDVLTNEGTIDDLRLAVDTLHGRYLALAAAMKSP